MHEIIEWIKFFNELGIKDFDVSTKPKSKKDLLKELELEIDDCKKCQLHKGRHNIVIADGSPEAIAMFIGEGPGEEEDKQGLPFVGRAGQLLNKMLAAIQLNRADVYIANIVKCRPPMNREPLPEEIKMCFPYLEKQIEIVKPKLIVSLGAPATTTLLGTKIGITELRGKFFKYNDDTFLLPTFHPAYLLRNPNKKREAWEDLKKVRKFLDEYGK
jgi:DNA polymerase